MNEIPTAIGVRSASQAHLGPAGTPRPPVDLKKSLLRTTFAAIPNLLILGLLAAVGWWGHHSGWKLPKFSQLTGAAAVEKDDWCEEHSVPDSECIECNAKLMPRSKAPGWCAIHGVHECPFEKLEIAQMKITPAVTPEMLARAKRALEFTPRPQNISKCKLHQRRIQFASEAAVRKAGLEFAEVQEGPILKALSANGEITYDQSLVAKLSPAVPGRVWHVYKQLGQSVRKGEVLALVDAIEIGKTKAEFVSAANLVALRAQRLETLRPLAGTVVPEASYLEAQNTLREAEGRLITAQQALVNFGLAVRAEDYKGMNAQDLNVRLRFLGLPPELVKGIVVRARDGVTLRVGDLGDVSIGHEIRRGAVTADGRGEVVRLNEPGAQSLAVNLRPRLRWLVLVIRARFVWLLGLDCFGACIIVLVAGVRAAGFAAAPDGQQEEADDPEQGVSRRNGS